MATLNSTFLIFFAVNRGVCADPRKYYFAHVVEDRRGGRIERVTYVVFSSFTCLVF